MGREWLYKATGAGDGRKSPFSVTGKKEKCKNTSSSGCMNAIYNLFDVQHHQFRLHHPSFMSSESVIDDRLHCNFSFHGIEAPRNSLESPESAIKVAQVSSKAVNKQPKLNIPVSRLQIKTNHLKFTDNLSSQCCNSPGTKTPNLVARLMGLDILPDQYSSPRASASSVTTNSHRRSCSLPITPRFSTASRHSTDNNEYHHRLSLQLDKENIRGQESRPLGPKQIMKKTRERIISRRLGTDITNTMSPARGKCHRRDSNLLLLKPKMAPVMEPIGNAKQDESRALSSSPKVRLLENKSNLNKPKPQTPKPLRQMSVMRPENVVKDEKIKRIASERYDLRLKKMNQQEKSTALPNQVVNVKNVKKFQSFKKEMTSSSSTTKRLSQKQVSLPSNLNSSYNSNDTHNLKSTTTNNSCSSQLFQPSTIHQLKLRHPAVTAIATTTDCSVFEWDMRRLLTTVFVAEVKEMVVEIESEILGNLVDEIAREMVAFAASDWLRSHVLIT